MRTLTKMKNILKELVVKKMDEDEDIETNGIAKMIRKMHQLKNNYVEIIFCLLNSDISDIF